MNLDHIGIITGAAIPGHVGGLSWLSGRADMVGMTVDLDGPVRLIDGPSAAALGFRSVRLIILASVCAIPVGMESLLPSHVVVYWGVAWSLLNIGIVGLFFRGIVLSRRAEKAEIACGYTTALTKAIANPDLYLLDRNTLAVLSGPGEQRPLNIRKAETRKALKRRRIYRSTS